MGGQEEVEGENGKRPENAMLKKLLIKLEYFIEGGENQDNGEESKQQKGGAGRDEEREANNERNDSGIPDEGK